MGLSNAIRVHQYITSYIGKSLKWGARDCYLLTIGYVDWMKGTNFKHWVEGKYDSKRTALKFLNDNHFDLNKFLTHCACASPVSDYRFGDILLAKEGIIKDSMIYIGEDRVLAASRSTGSIILGRGFDQDDYYSYRL